MIESTFLSADVDVAARYGHLTVAQAGRVAAECGVRKLVLTYFSQRYSDPACFAREAAAEFGGEVAAATDGARIRVPARRGD